MKNIPIRRIAHFLGAVGDFDLQVSGYQIDSRRINQGDLFFAWKGLKVDGHDYLEDVKKRGGIAAVVSKSYQGPDHGLILFRVENVLDCLQGLARFFLEENKSKIIGITGSMGKTTTKEFLATLLSGKFKVGKTFSSYNTKLTFPLMLLNRDGDEDVLVLEMAMSEPGDIERLLQIAVPDIAILTQLALAHVASFPGGIEEIAKEKMSIFSNSKTKKAIFYHGLYRFPDLVAAIPGEKITFSQEDRSSDYFLSCSENKYLIDERGVRAYQFDLPFKQSHILHNFLAAVSAARQMNLEWDEINRQVPFLELPKMRFEQFEKEGILFINDAYNANPDSMRAALSHIPEPKEGGKKIAVLGTMVELGKYSPECHLEMGRFAQKYADHLLAFGEEAAAIAEGFSEVKKPAEHFSDHKSLTEALKSLMSPGDVVLVKGSRKMQLEKVFEILEAVCDHLT